jgi:large subunit ribosomal protein L23
MATGQRQHEHRDASIILRRPYITEKSNALAAQHAYVFEVESNATKIEIRRAVEELYKVRPVRVNVAVRPDKRIVYRGKAGVKQGFKKAIVYLKAGESIQFV